MRLIVVAPESDAERKRVDYLCEKHKLSLGLSRGSAMWLLSASDDVHHFAQELAAKTSPDGLQVYHVEPADPGDLGVTPIERAFSLELSAAPSAVTHFVAAYVLMKRKAVRQADARDVHGARYVLRTNKGVVDVVVHCVKAGAGARLDVRIQGIESAVRHVESQLRGDLDIFARGLDQ